MEGSGPQGRTPASLPRTSSLPHTLLCGRSVWSGSVLVVRDFMLVHYPTLVSRIRLNAASSSQKTRRSC